jgi:hypothetical protein
MAKVKPLASSSNTEIWDRLCETDPGRTKEITGKNYRGTSINPNYIYEKLTEVFGPCGEGWGFRIVNQGYESGTEDATLHWVQIEFFHSSNKEFTIPAFGCTPFTGEYRSGPFMDEDAPKKSLTDALTKAAQLIGMSADIFGGQWNDSKYVDELKEKYGNGDEAEAHTVPTPKPPVKGLSKVDYPKIAKKAEDGDKNLITPAQGKLIYAKFMVANFSKEQMKEWIACEYGVESSKELPRSCVNEIIKLSDSGQLQPLGAGEEVEDDDIPF